MKASRTVLNGGDEETYHTATRLVPTHRTGSSQEVAGTGEGGSVTRKWSESTASPRGDDASGAFFVASRATAVGGEGHVQHVRRGLCSALDASRCSQGTRHDHTRQA